jgi:hypothetical protein
MCAALVTAQSAAPRGLYRAYPTAVLFKLSSYRRIRSIGSGSTLRIVEGTLDS